MQVGLRSGYAIPMGSISGSGQGVTEQKLGDTVSGVIPIQVDAGIKVASFYVGAYGQYGIVLPNNCPTGASCSGSDVRVGVDGELHFLPLPLLDPYVGLGLGYEWLNLSAKANGASSSVDGQVSGFEYVHATAGLDLKFGSLAVGGYLQYSLGQFSNQSITPTIPNFPSSIPNTALHEWFTIGARVRYSLL